MLKDPGEIVLPCAVYYAVVSLTVVVQIDDLRQKSQKDYKQMTTDQERFMTMVGGCDVIVLLQINGKQLQPSKIFY